MSKINKIKLSGTSYDIEDSNATKTVKLTQSQYDALVQTGQIDPNAFYIITDAEAADLTQYWTSAQTESAITQAVSGKQDTLSAGTNITIVDNVISAEGGGGITSGEVQTMIDSSISGKADTSSLATVATSGSYNDLTNKPTIPTVPTSNTAFTNDAGYLVANDITGKTDTSAFTAHTADTTIHVTTAQTAAWDAKSDFSGSYNDLTDKPTIPTVPTSNTAFTNDAGYITSDAISGKADTSAVTESITAAVSGKADTSAVTAVQDSLSGYVTTDTLQDITAQKTFVGDSSNKKKSIKFKQYDNRTKVGFVVVNSASTDNELATFEFRPDTYTDSSRVSHPLLYFGHYRNNGIATAGVPQTMVGFRQYDQSGGAAYHYLMPLPAEAKTPFSLTTTFKDYFAPLGFKVDSGGTMVTTDNTGVVDLSSYLGGGGSSYSAGTGIDITNEVISVTGKVDTSTYETYTAATATAIGNKLATSDFNTYSGAVDTTINSKASQSDLSTLSGTVTAHTANTDIHVTTAQTAAWNAKSDFSGSYNDLTDKPTIPSKTSDLTNDSNFATSGYVDSAVSGKANSSDVYTKSQTSGATEISTALSGKQDTLSAGTNITIVDNVISAEGGGGGMTEDDELLLATALTDLNDRKIDASEVKSNYQKKGDYVTTNTLNTRLADYETALDEQNVEEVTAYALNDLNDRFGGLKIAKITESEYEALTTKDENTLYIVIADPS